MPAPPDTQKDSEHGYEKAGLVFSVAAFVIALFLLVLIPYETTWVARQPFHKQPAFWPIVSIASMVVFGAIE